MLEIRKGNGYFDGKIETPIKFHSSSFIALPKKTINKRNIKKLIPIYVLPSEK